MEDTSPSSEPLSKITQRLGALVPSWNRYGISDKTKGYKYGFLLI